MDRLEPLVEPRAIPERRRPSAPAARQGVAVRVERDVPEPDDLREPEVRDEPPRRGGVGLGEAVEELEGGHPPPSVARLAGARAGQRATTALTVNAGCAAMAFFTAHWSATRTSAS